MLQLKNNTPFSSALIPNVNKQGNNFILVVIKATFNINPEVASVSIADEQQKILYEDVFYGEPGTSSIKYEADTALTKNAVDFVVNGHVYAPQGRQIRELNAGVKVGNHRHDLRVFGDRFWYKEMAAWRASSPAPFSKMPLVYENSYGGSLTKTGSDFCVYNPVGKGFCKAESETVTEVLQLPNIENPFQLIRYKNDNPLPVGTGFLGRNWQPRLGYAGTYDDAWKKHRMPLLPLNFDDHYFSGAHPNLRFNNSLLGELVTLNNLSENGLITFQIPRYEFNVSLTIKRNKQFFTPMLDTVVVEPDEARVLMSWRAAVPCYQHLLYIDNVSVHYRKSE